MVNAQQARSKTMGFTRTFKSSVLERIEVAASKGYSVLKVTVPEVSMYHADVKVGSQGKYIADWLIDLGYKVTPLTSALHIIGSGRFDQADILEVEW